MDSGEALGILILVLIVVFSLVITYGIFIKKPICECNCGSSTNSEQTGTTSSGIQTTTTTRTSRTMTPQDTNCINSGGIITTNSCCLNVNDFPNNCLVGSCACSSSNSHTVKVCQCPQGMCWGGNSCIPGSPTQTSTTSKTSTTTQTTQTSSTNEPPPPPV